MNVSSSSHCSRAKYFPLETERIQSSITAPHSEPLTKFQSKAKDKENMQTSSNNRRNVLKYLEQLGNFISSSGREYSYVERAVVSRHRRSKAADILNNNYKTIHKRVKSPNFRDSIAVERQKLKISL